MLLYVPQSAVLLTQDACISSADAAIVIAAIITWAQSQHCISCKARGGKMQWLTGSFGMLSDHVLFAFAWSIEVRLQ